MITDTRNKVMAALDELVDGAHNLRDAVAECPELDPRLADAFTRFAGTVELEARTNEAILTTVVGEEEG